MNIGSIYISKKKLAGYLFLIILMVSIPIGVVLVQKTQVLKSKASSSPALDAFYIKDGDTNKDLICEDGNPPICNVSTQSVTISVKSLNALITQ